MRRWFICALLTLSAFAQSGRPPAAPAETLYGMLLSISATDLALDTGEDRPVHAQINNGTKYLSTMGKVKASDFEPGDKITVEATHADGAHFISTAITLNKKGSAEDKQNAKSKLNPPAAPATSAAAPAPSGGNDAPSADRPRLNRANSGGGVSSAQPASSAGTSSGNVPSGTTSPAPARRPAPADSTDDSGPPTLRRNTPSTQSAAAQPAPAQSAPPQRPSLSADDVNGVTRTPAAPPPSAGEDPIIDQTREVAASFTQTLPNYIVKQFTTRYVSQAANGRRTSWQPLDLVTSDLVYLDGKENYLNIMVNGRATKDASQNGSWSEGEFASSLNALLSRFSATEFRNKRPVTIVNRPAYKYDYSIEQPRSAWRIETEGQSYQPAYDGSIWIDKETFRVLRIEMAARNMPRSFPIDTTESSLDYDFVLIGDQKYLLPVHSESLSCWRGTSQCSRNVIDFRNYKKYTADSNITFESTVPDK
jgi:hypothetical protein